MASPRTMLAPACVALAAAVSAASAADLRSPLTASGATPVPHALAATVGAFLPDESVWAAMKGEGSVRLVDVPLGPSRTATLVLHPVDPFAPDATIVLAERGPDGRTVERTLPRPDAQYWCGGVEGEPGSTALLARSAAGIHGYVEGAGGRVIVSSGPAGRGGAVLAYDPAALPEGAIDWDNWVCSAIPAPGTEPVLDVGVHRLAEPCRQVRLAIETDYEFYGRFAGAADPAAAATGYVGTIYAAMLQIYRRDFNALPQVGYLRLWSTAADPWSAADTSTELTEFRNHWVANMSGVSRNVAQFLSARSLGGGIAWMSSVCNTYAYSVAGNLSGTFPYPLLDFNGQNWDIIVTSHELGHNFGAPHTHAYCPPVDSCAPSGSFGPCQTSQVCSNAGTIMSYCHTCSGGTANIQLSFHPQNIASVSTYLAGVGCTLAGSALPPAAVPDALRTWQWLPGTLDVLANEIDLNCDPVTIDSLPARSTAGATLAVQAGAGLGGRDLVSYVPPTGFAGSDSFTYRLRDSSGQYSPTVSVAVTVDPLRLADRPWGDQPGLDARYFALSAPTVLPAFDALTPYSGVVVTQVNFPANSLAFATSGRPDEVGAVFSGWVNVPQTGLYTFFTSSDDGSRLLIGNQVVVTNDGIHLMAEASGTIGLQAGKHPIRIEFFEATGQAGCIASMSGPGIAKAAIEAGRLTRGGSMVPGDLNGDGRVDGADLGMLLSAWGTGAAWADVDGDGRVDGADLGKLLALWRP